MQYSLMVTAGPWHPAAHSALRLARALRDRGHLLHRLFFYRDGVLLAQPPEDASPERAPLLKAWRHFIAEQHLDAVVCSSAAHRRALPEDDERLAPFVLSGLGQWAEAVSISDRILTLGP